jgi:hypothetical protein
LSGVPWCDCALGAKTNLQSTYTTWSKLLNDAPFAYLNKRKCKMWKSW